MILILSGVSGAGKDTVKKEILRKIENAVTIPSYTTRKIRNGETEGVQYHYVSVEEFVSMINEGKLYEYSKHYENYYGTSKEILDSKISEGKIVVKDIDVNGARDLKKLEKKINTKIVTIFLDISKQEMISRIHKREEELGEKTDEIEFLSRLERYDYEALRKTDYDYVIENISLEKCIKDIVEIIEKEGTGV